MAGIQMFRMDIQRKTEGHISPEPIGKGEVNLLEPGDNECALFLLWKFGPESHFKLGFPRSLIHVVLKHYLY